MIGHTGAEPRQGNDVLPVTQPDREAAVETLPHAAAAGRPPWQEFSERVGTALTAETQDQLKAATAGPQAVPPAGSVRTVSSMVTFFGHRWQAGRWRLPGALCARALFGDLHLDLRVAVVNDHVIDIAVITLFGGLLGDVYVRTPAAGEKPPSWWSWVRLSRW
jgi:hypothetical protein